MARYTGLSRTFIDGRDPRVPLGHFSTELLRDKHLMTSRLDSRFAGYQRDAVSRRELLSAAAALAAPAFLRGAQDRPNVLFILADEWRAQATGYNGDTNAPTPVLDRLAATSLNYRNAVSGTPVCCPYRASLLTGQYPLTHGVFINDVELKPKSLTWGETFAQAGYHTGYIGKWHVYGSPDGKYGRRLLPVPEDKHFGFQYWKACECSHDYNHSLYYEGADPTPRYWPGYDAFAQTDDACDFITRQAKARDAYSLILSLGPPHFPYPTAPAKYREMFAAREIKLRPNVPPQFHQEATDTLRGYYAHMAALDECFARLLATLERTGTAENTIVIFTSDHGDMMRSQGLPMKLYPWEESARVPFLVRYPRQFGKKGQRLGRAAQFARHPAHRAGHVRPPDARWGGGSGPLARCRPQRAALAQRALEHGRSNHPGAPVRLRRVPRIALCGTHLRALDPGALAALRQSPRPLPDAQSQRPKRVARCAGAPRPRIERYPEGTQRRISARRRLRQPRGARALSRGEHAGGPHGESVGRLGVHLEGDYEW